jgi:hypothetical protein
MSMKGLIADPRRRWAAIRYVLGMVQMAGAVISLVLLALTGVSTASLTSVVLTGMATTVSVVLFGARKGDPQ